MRVSAVRYAMVGVAAPLCGCQTVAERPPEDERFFVGQ